MRHYFSIKVPRDALSRHASILAHKLPDTMVEEWRYPFDENAVIFEGWHEGTPEDYAEIERLMKVARG